MDESNSLVSNLDLEYRYNWGLFPTVEVERVFVAVYGNGSYSVRASLNVAEEMYTSSSKRWNLI